MDIENEENTKSYHFVKIKDFKYGENPHQKASLYSYDKELDYDILSNNEITYNGILDLSASLEIAFEFFDVAACVIVKQTIPCAVALSADVEGAFDKALDADPVSLFASVAAFTRKIELSLAKKLNLLSLSAIIAPDFAPDALEELKKKKNLRIVKLNTPLERILNFQNEEITLTPFGALVQQNSRISLDVNTFKVVSNKKPEQAELEDMIFATKVVKHAKSNAIVVAKNLRTIGICAGQANRALSVEFALHNVCDSPKGSIIASDGAIATIDNIQIAAQNRVAGIIQPGGSLRDKEIIACADKYSISMVTTGIRHFKH